MKLRRICYLLFICLSILSFSGCSENLKGAEIHIKNEISNRDFIINVDIDNDVEVYSFTSNVETANNVEWHLYTDIAGKNEILTKTVQPSIGDNIYYIFSKASNEEAFYTVNLHRLEIYNVYFDTKGGTPIPSQKVQEKGLITPVSNPIKQGYDFSSWDYDFNTPVMSNLTVSAKWIGKEYTIVLNTNGGKPLESNLIKVRFGSSVSLPKPERDYYDFKYWTYNNTQVNENSWNIDADATLIATWQPTSYQINYNLNGGINNANNPTSYTIETSPITIGTPTKTGYTFKGWQINNDDELVSNPIISRGSHGNISFTAIWETDTYKITLLAPGSDCDNKKLTVEYGQSITLPTPNYSDDNYTFSSWSDGTTNINSTFIYNYTSNMTFTALKHGKKINGNLKYASSTSKPVYITYMVNGEVYKKVAASELEGIPYQYFEYKTSDFEDGKDIFIGWYEDSNYEKYFNYSGELSEDKTLYARFIKSSELGVDNNSYVANFKTDFGDGVDNNEVGKSYYLYTGEIADYTMLPYLSQSSDGDGIEITFETVNQSPTSGTKQTFSYSDWGRRDYNIPFNPTSVTLTKNALYKITFKGTYSYCLGYQSFYINLYPNTYVTDLKSSCFSSSVCIEYGKHFSLGIPNLGKECFVGWSDKVDGSNIVTDNKGESLAVSKYKTDTMFYPIFDIDKNSITCSFNSLDDSYTLTKYNTSETEVVLPSLFDDGKNGLAPIKGLNGTNIFYNSMQIEKLTVLNNIVRMSSGCLKYLGNLKSLSLPFIGANNEHNISKNKYSLGYLFGTSSFTGSEATVQKYYGRVDYESSTYYIPTSLKQLYVEGGNLNYGALYNCKYLESVKLGNGVKEIESYAIYDCVCISNFYIGDNVEIIRTSAFKIENGVNPQLKSIFIPKSVLTIERYAFINYSSITTFNCEAKSKPSEWDYYWCSDNYSTSKSKINWGCSR